MGTSASAPLAAGAVALVRASHPDRTADTIVTLRLTGLPVPHVNAAAALAQSAPNKMLKTDRYHLI